MNTMTILGFTVLILAIYVYTIISSRSYRYLTPEEKERSGTTFGNLQAILLLPVLLLVWARAVFVYTDRILPVNIFAPPYAETAATVTLLIFFPYWILNSFLVFRSMKRKFPNRKFIWRQRLANAAVVLGTLVYIYMLFSPLVVPYRLKAYRHIYDVRDYK
jgi:hypothetical protein